MFQNSSFALIGGGAAFLFSSFSGSLFQYSRQRDGFSSSFLKVAKNSSSRMHSPRSIRCQALEGAARDMLKFIQPTGMRLASS